MDVNVITPPSLQKEIAEVASRAPFCLKDPRFSFTYPAWKPYVDDAVMIAVFRHPEEVCTSVISFFARRKVGYRPLFIYSVWLRIYDLIFRYAEEGENWLFVDYADLLNEKAFERIEARLGTMTDRSIIDGTLQRSKREKSPFPAPDECDVMYERLSAASLK